MSPVVERLKSTLDALSTSDRDEVIRYLFETIGIQGDVVMERLRQECGPDDGKKFVREIYTQPDLLLGAFRDRLASRQCDIAAFDEAAFQIEFNSVLQELGYNSIREYPYPGKKETCDLVVIDSVHAGREDLWIEFKPISWFSNYWNPSKFLSGAFQHDIRKLAAQNGYRYFLLFIESAVEEFDFSEVDVAECRKTLSDNAVVSSVRKWAGGAEAITSKSFPINDKHGHLLMWIVQKYSDE